MINRILALLCWLLITTCSLPVLAADVYHMGSSDILSFTVYGHPELKVDAVTIDEHGDIPLPLLGKFHVGGLTTGEAEDKISVALQNGGFIVHPIVNLFIQQYASQQVVVLGQVLKPGKYVLQNPSLLTDALALAGGIVPTGSDTVVLIHKEHNALVSTTVDTLALFKEHQLNLDEPIAGGDIIYVPRAEVFYIYGEVQRPGQYRLEKDMSVMQAISEGGGITQLGTESGIEIHRKQGGAVITMQGKPGTILLPDDVVYVKRSLF